ncbi:carbon storage regulator [Stutzerimonas stutzeri]|uniref:carbon storage regulator n=1 Tax=Stutzerimonas stutzeri TaxID=316 RepID=UPI00210D4E9E|nr:carbon storage regulator [Stutzerimonas stutzeri]MCQ4258153.1 carbon storage regulator [Stutzerimonas stutzeri]
MGYLVLTRTEGERITLRVQPGTDADDLLAQLLLDGITIRVGHLKSGQVKIGIEAPEDLQILRAELEDR